MTILAAQTISTLSAAGPWPLLTIVGTTAGVIATHRSVRWRQRFGPASRHVWFLAVAISLHVLVLAQTGHGDDPARAANTLVEIGGR